MAVPPVSASTRRRRMQRAFAYPRLCLLLAGGFLLLAVVFFKMASAPSATKIVRPVNLLPSPPASSDDVSVRDSRPMSSAGESRPKLGPTKTEIETWLEGKAGRWSDEEVIAAILQSEESERGSFLERVAEAFRLHPEKLEPLVEKLALGWARQADGAAILFLNRLRDSPGGALPSVVQLETKLMGDWIGRGFAAVGHSLQQQGMRAAIPATELDLLTYLVQNDQKEKLGDLLQWVGNLEGQENRSLKLAVSEALVRMAQPENFRPIAALLENDLTDQRAAVCLSQFAARNAVESPDDVVAWLKKLGPKAAPWSSLIVNDFFDQLGRTHPDLAVHLLNAGFTDNFASTNFAPPGPALDSPPANAADQLYDLALSKVLNSVMVLDPDYALTCAQYFNDPRLQDHFTKTAQHLQLSGARRNHQ